MRRPKLNDFDDGDGNGPNYEDYCDAMDTYADEQRDDAIERAWEQEEESIKEDT